jgi:hypothetical protein
MHIEYYRPIFLGICGGSMYHIQVMLVMNWIGLIDSAISKTKPAWSENLGKFAYISCYIVEVLFGFLEYHVGEPSHMEAASNGNMRAIKYAYTNMFILIWTAIGICYWQKLSSTLKAGAKEGPNAQLRKIQKYIFALVIGSVLGSLLKAVLIHRFIGKTLFRNMPVCGMKGFYFGPTTSTYVVILVVEYAICYAHQPGRNTVRSFVSRATSTIMSRRAATFSRRRSSVNPSQIAAFNSPSKASSTNASAVESSSVAPQSETEPTSNA